MATIFMWPAWVSTEHGDRVVEHGVAIRCHNKVCFFKCFWPHRNPIELRKRGCISPVFQIPRTNHWKLHDLVVIQFCFTNERLVNSVVIAWSSRQPSDCCVKCFAGYWRPFVCRWLWRKWLEPDSETFQFHLLRCWRGLVTAGSRWPHHALGLF